MTKRRDPTIAAARVTPGKWEIVDLGGAFSVRESIHGTVVVTCSKRGSASDVETQMANLRLICAAKELRDAARLLPLLIWTSTRSGSPITTEIGLPVIDRLIDAIFKAYSVDAISGFWKNTDLQQAIGLLQSVEAEI